MTNRYAKVQEFVKRLTDEPTFQTFFTLYLMAENEAEKDSLGQKLWHQVGQLPATEQSLLRAEFTRCFLKIPTLASQLLIKTNLVVA